MYTTIIAWLKTYTDLYLKAYYDGKQDPKWYVRDMTVVTLAKDGDPDEIPSGMAKSTYLLRLEFFKTKLNDTSDITTAFNNLLSDLTQLYLYDNPILPETYPFLKITRLAHAYVPESKNLYGYILEIDLVYGEYIS